jgi:hypothetical protein
VVNSISHKDVLPPAIKLPKRRPESDNYVRPARGENTIILEGF